MKNQCERLLRHLEKNGSVTMLDALGLGIGRLSARVYDLRAAGYDIGMELETGKNKYGETTRYARYFLKGEHNV